MRTKVLQSLTAYSCRICKKYQSENLLELSESNTEPLDLKKLLKGYFTYIEDCKIDKYTSRALLLTTGNDRKEIDGMGVRLHIQPKAGKALENFDVVNHITNEVKGYKGEDHSAVYTHHIMFYLNGEKNVFLFHHYGQSGCKTAFLNTFNEYLAGENLVAHLDVLMSNSMFLDSNKYKVEKLSLIKTYEELSTDKADNIGKKKRKRIEKE